MLITRGDIFIMTIVDGKIMVINKGEMVIMTGIIMKDQWVIKDKIIDIKIIIGIKDNNTKDRIITIMNEIIKDKIITIISVDNMRNNMMNKKDIREMINIKMYPNRKK